MCGKVKRGQVSLSQVRLQENSKNNWWCALCREIKIFQTIFFQIKLINFIQGTLVLYNIKTTIKFHFSGYHHCTKEEASVLGALIYRVKYGESKTELQNLTQMLRELIPTDLVSKF